MYILRHLQGAYAHITSAYTCIYLNFSLFIFYLVCTSVSSVLFLNRDSLLCCQGWSQTSKLLSRWHYGNFGCTWLLRFFVCSFILHKFSLCSPGCYEIHYVDQTGLELEDSPVFAFQVLGLKACTTMPGIFFILIFSWILLLFFTDLHAFFIHSQPAMLISEF